MRDGLVLHAVEGAVGGALGTMFMQQALRLSLRMPPAVQPPDVSEDPGEYVALRIERLRGKPLPPNVHRAMVQGLHWAYGIGWASLLGMSASRRIPIRTAKDALVAGTAMGTLVWAVGYVGWLPATHLAKPVHKQGAGHVVSSLLTHVAYGVLAALPILLIDRARERRARRRLRLPFIG
jgi:hypothetical protein